MSTERAKASGRRRIQKCSETSDYVWYKGTARTFGRTPSTHFEDTQNCDGGRAMAISGQGTRSLSSLRASDGAMYFINKQGGRNTVTSSQVSQSIDAWVSK